MPEAPNQYRPKHVSAPGETIGDLLEERGIKQTELATRMDVTPKFINELVAGKAPITPATALALEKALDMPAVFWLTRDAVYQEALARQKSNADLAANVSWLNELPIKDMCKFRWIPARKQKPDLVDACLKYFGVASVEAWRKQYVTQANASAAYRGSQTAHRNPGAVAAWLRQGERIAAKNRCSAFDREKFVMALSEARSLTREPDPTNFVPALTTMFAASGVAVVVVRAPKGCPVSGATRWLSPTKALVQLSLRYLRDDAFWFTFFHECGHIALHGKKMLFLENDGLSGAEENQANDFAAEQLIPTYKWQEFQPYTVTESAILEFAEQLGIASGIVLGRLQQEKRVPWGRFNHLKYRYAWDEEE